MANMLPRHHTEDTEACIQLKFLEIKEQLLINNVIWCEELMVISDIIRLHDVKN